MAGCLIGQYDANQKSDDHNDGNGFDAGLVHLLEGFANRGEIRFPGLEIVLQPGHLAFETDAGVIELLAGSFQRRLAIEGDTEVGLAVKNLLDGIDFSQFPTVFQQALKQVGSAQQYIHANSLETQASPIHTTG